MGYQAVYLVEYGYQEDPYRFINIGTDGSVCFESWDGSRIRRHSADGIWLYRRDRGGDETYEVLHYEGVPAEVYVTDSRLLLRIPRHSESLHEDETRAAVLCESSMERYVTPEEMMLAGMIRYEWISQISYQRKVSRGTEECVRIYYRDLSEAKWHLDLIFPKEADAERLANLILHRACRYRLAMTDEKSDEEVYFFNRYLSDYEIEPAEDPKRHMATVRFPTQYPAPGGGDTRPYL